MRATARPPGAVALGRLIDILMGCLDEPGVDEMTPVRVEPEFGRAAGALFASGASITFPAGDGQADCRPWVAIEWRSAPPPGQVTDGSMRSGLGKLDPVLCNALARNDYDVARLRGLGTDYCGTEVWHDLHDIPNIGPARLLNLVNFFREAGVELPWFADFDRFTAPWQALSGRHRASPPPG